MRIHITRAAVALMAAVLMSDAGAATLFVEAEAFEVKGDGWRTETSRLVRAASGLKTLNGSSGSPVSTARAQLEVVTPGAYRVWARYMETPGCRGPFDVHVRQNGRELAKTTFDLAPRPDVGAWLCEWSLLGDVPLEAGFAELALAKHGQKNCSGLARQADCFLLTDDLQLKPSHFAYGPQTWMRVTLGDVYPKPVYVHVFTDHYRAPWFAHYAISKAGMEQRLQPVKAGTFLRGGETTGWVNITPMLYQDSGARLVVSVRESYYLQCPRLKAVFDFATEPSDTAVVKTFTRDCASIQEDAGVTVNIIVPPDLVKPENRERLTTDSDLAEAYGRLADLFAWPTEGKPPERFPFLVSSSLNQGVDRRVFEREQKTLDYFGFNNRTRPVVGGGWRMLDGCYCQPDMPRMEAMIRDAAETFRKSGRRVEDIAFSMLTDEPTGQPLRHLAGCPACTAAFRTWLRGELPSPAACGVADWEAARPVADTNNPALYYYSQRFRTRALGAFMGVQREMLRKAYGADIPAGANFSDGATYVANAYSQGVDYFELLGDGVQNAIWSENWGNGAASPQCTTYNVELLRSAALERGETVGHHLIAYAGRRPWDIKLKAVSQAARDVKIFETFYYGPAWGGHEGGPPWASSSWGAKTNVWRAVAELAREIGGAEDLLYPAKKAPARVALLYASSSDIWTEGRNYAYGFDRMFIWLALTHGQTPVDFLSEKRVAEGALEAYRVCYLSGPNLTRAAAAALAAWVGRGGVLVATADAAARDEFDRPLGALETVLPAGRQPAECLQPQLGSGCTIDSLRALDRVAVQEGETEVLSVRQALVPKPGAAVLGVFSNGAPAYVSGRYRKGRVYQAGFLPGLAYVKPALAARRELERASAASRTEAKAEPPPSAATDEDGLLLRSHAPWRYAETVRSLIAGPVAAAGVKLPVKCSVPLVDAVLMEGEKGAVVPLANFTLQPLPAVALSVRPARKVRRIEAVHAGPIPFRRRWGGRVEFSLPLQETDFVKLYY